MPGDSAWDGKPCAAATAFIKMLYVIICAFGGASF